MKYLKKVLAITLCVMFVFGCFAGCSSSNTSDEITDKTMLIAYTEENAPFLYTDEKGNLAGFDVELFDMMFGSIKQDYKSYKFIKVDEGYRLGEDPAYINDNGEQFVAYIMAGGLMMDNGTVNEDYTVTDYVISNEVITITAANSKVKDYASFDGAKVGVVGDAAKYAFDQNASIKNACGAITEYKDAKTALADLDAGKLDALVIDEFTIGKDAEKYTRLNGNLDKFDYVYGFKKWDWFDEAVNTAIYELKSDQYNDKDEFTPLVEKYFGYNASDFSFVPSDKK